MRTPGAVAPILQRLDGVLHDEEPIVAPMLRIYACSVECGDIVPILDEVDGTREINALRCTGQVFCAGCHGHTRRVGA